VKPRPRRQYKEGQHRQNVEIRRKKIQDKFLEEHHQLFEDLANEKKEDLHEFAQRIASLPPGGNTIWVDKIRTAQINNRCLFCDKQLELYTSKLGNVYLANADHSPHRKVYKCCNTWGEYNGTN